MVRADGPKSVRVISVIEVKANRGLGIKDDPVREITQYWDMDGNLLAERDPDPQFAFRSGYMGVKALAEYY